MKRIYPKEFLEYTSEVHRYRHRKRSLVIYGIFLLFLLGFILILPFVSVPLYISAKGRVQDVPSAETLAVAECYIQAVDIGLIQVNTPVTFRIDAYDHNHWGVATGKILEVSREAVMLEDHAVFRIRCSINETYLSLQNNHRGYLHKGQSLTADIMLTERSLFELLRDQ